MGGFATTVLSVAAVVLAAVSAGSPSGLQFREVGRTAGLQADMHCGGPEKRWIPEANGSGAAWLDYDNDGWMDLLIVNGSSMDRLREIVAGQRPPSTKGSVYLFHNLGNGHFADVTEKAGLENPYWGTGANAADCNNDGYTDILITTIGVDLLYRNNADGTFTEVGRSSGLSQKPVWHTGSAFGDFDGDGKLDLFITGYIDIHSLSFSEPAPICDYQGKHVFCGPVGMKGEHSLLFHNNGNGTFTDVTAKSEIGAAPPSHGFTAVADDFNGDGKTDIFVANDSDPNLLFLNQADGTFKESALDRGVAFNADGRAQSNMGVAVGDYDASGHTGILTTTFFQDYFPLFKQDNRGFYEEIASSVGLATATMNYLGWACGLTDFENSGRRDFWTANGHVYPSMSSYLLPVVIFRNTQGKFQPVYSYPQPPVSSYRGGASADFNNDGKMDLLVLPVSGAPILLENQTSNDNNWIGIWLRGKSSNRDAIGANVKIEACGVTQSDSVRNGGSYLSRNDPRLHFGFGSCNKIDRITVKWPSGATQVVKGSRLNQYISIEEGA
jgi:enediyne biosynthesis protein E4